MSTVQVIIPCYNYGRYLRSCVDSVLSQDGVDVKVLIIDDCSSDNSADICRALQAEDDRVSFILHTVNRGHIATYNEGLALATADYLVLLSADDLLTPGALDRAAAIMDCDPSVGMVYGHPLMVRDEKLPPARTRMSGSIVWNGAKWIEMMCRTGRNFIVCPEVVMRTSIQHRIGGYTAALPHSGDMEMWLRAAAVSNIARVRGADQAYYRLHALSMQRTIHAGQIFDLKGRQAAFQSAFDKEPGQLPQAGRLFRMANRALALTAVRHALQAIRCGWELTEQVDAYQEFAGSTYPDIIRTKEWRALERARHKPRGWLQTALARQAADVRGRIVWRQWRRSGVYHRLP